MHIYVESVDLSGLHFEAHSDFKELDFNLHVACSSHFITENELIQNFTFNVMHGVSNPPFDMEFTLTAKFISEGEGQPSLRDFAEFNGPAYVVPYARELISNITSRSEVPTLVIPPVNIFSLIEEGKLDHIDEPKLIKDDLENIEIED